jgi:hypothetical protein
MPTFSHSDAPARACTAHPTTAATNTCSRCSRATCVRCTAFVRGQPVCFTCEAGARRRFGPLLARVAVLGLVVAVDQVKGVVQLTARTAKN